MATKRFTVELEVDADGPLGRDGAAEALEQALDDVTFEAEGSKVR